ncbi:MAG: hypothetical protein ACREDF_11925 [Thermoplasmata archaeon]
MGLFIFVAVIAALVIAGLALIVTAPYYVATKRPEIVPDSSMTLDQLRER